MFNRVIFGGNTVRSPELKEFNDGGCIATFTLAIDRPYPDIKGDKQTDFIPVVAKNDLARSVMQYNRQGRLLMVEGRMQTRHYDPDDGSSRRYVTECVASFIKYLDGKIPEDAGSQGESYDGHPANFDDGQGHSGGQQRGSNNRSGNQNQGSGGNQGGGRQEQPAASGQRSSGGNGNRGNTNNGNPGSQNTGYSRGNNNNGGYQRGGNASSNRSTGSNGGNQSPGRSSNDGGSRSNQQNNNRTGSAPWSH